FYGLRCLRLCVSSLLFFFSSRRRHTRSKRDWSSDVCSSDLSFRNLYCILIDRMNNDKQSHLPHVHEKELELFYVHAGTGQYMVRSEERRVGKECRSRWWR